MTDNKTLRTIGKGIGIGLIFGVVSVGQHYWNQSDLQAHSEHTQQAIAANQDVNTQKLDEMQAKFDKLAKENARLASVDDDCQRANTSLRHDLEEVKRILGVHISNDHGHQSPR